MQTFLGPRAIAGTLQLPYPSVEMWRRRLAEFPADDYLLVATIDGEVVGNLGLHAASKSPRRRHVGNIGMAVRDDRQGRGWAARCCAPPSSLPTAGSTTSDSNCAVYTDNLAALHLYRKFGFAIEGTCRAYAFRDGSTWMRIRWRGCTRRSG